MIARVLEFLTPSFLPVAALSQVFGLHDNADISKDQQGTQLLFDTLLMTGGSGGGGGGSGEEDLVDGLVKDILKRMPANFDIEKAQYKYPVLYEESMNQVPPWLIYPRTYS